VKRASKHLIRLWSWFYYSTPPPSQIGDCNHSTRLSHRFELPGF